MACVAKTADAKFGKYYDSFIPGIKAIVTVAAPKAGTDPQVCLLAHDGAVRLPKMIPTFREFGVEHQTRGYHQF